MSPRGGWGFCSRGCYKDSAPDGADGDGFEQELTERTGKKYPKGISSFSPALPRRWSGYAGWTNMNGIYSERVESFCGNGDATPLGLKMFLGT